MLFLVPVFAFQMFSGRVITPLVQIVSLVQEYQETALSVRMLGTVMNHPPERRRSSGLTPRLSGALAADAPPTMLPREALAHHPLERGLA